MERSFERIDLSDGQWWEVWTVVTRGMRKRIRQATLASLSGGIPMNGHGDSSDPDRIKAMLLSHPESINLNSVDDAYLLVGTKGWSWPELVSLEFIDNLSDEIVEPVLARLRLLYAEPTEEQAKKATEAS